MWASTDARSDHPIPSSQSGCETPVVDECWKVDFSARAVSLQKPSITTGKKSVMLNIDYALHWIWETNCWTCL